MFHSTDSMVADRRPVLNLSDDATRQAASPETTLPGVKDGQRKPTTLSLKIHSKRAEKKTMFAQKKKERKYFTN